MAEKDTVIKEELENEGVFDYSGLYKFVHGWLKEEGYGVNEDKYSEKVSGASRDVEIEWKATKKISDYFKIEIKLEYRIERMTEVEVEIDGEKKSMNKGKMKIKFKGTLIKDPKSKWENSAFERFLRDVYNKYVVPHRVDDMEGLVDSDVTKLKEQIKAFVDIKGQR